MAGEKDKLNPLIDFTTVLQTGKELGKQLDPFELADLLKSYKDTQGVSTQFVLNDGSLNNLNPATQTAVKNLYKETQKAYTMYEQANAFPTNSFKFGKNEILSNLYPQIKTAVPTELDDLGIEFFYNGSFTPGRMFHQEEIADVASVYLDSESGEIKSLNKEKLSELSDGFDVSSIDPSDLLKQSLSVLGGAATGAAAGFLIGPAGAIAGGIVGGISQLDTAKMLKAAGFKGPKLTLSTYEDVAKLNTEAGKLAAQLINTGAVNPTTNYKVKGEDGIDYYMWKTMTPEDDSFKKQIRSTWGPQTLHRNNWAQEIFLEATNDALMGGLGTLNFANYVTKKAISPIMTSKYVNNGSYDKQIEQEYNASNAWLESRLSTKAEIDDAESVFHSPVNLAKGVVDGAMQLVMTMGVGGIGKMTANGLIKASPKLFTTLGGKALNTTGKSLMKNLVGAPAQAFGSIYAASAANKEARKQGLSNESALLMSALAASTVMLTEKMTGGNWANKLLGQDIAESYGSKIVADITGNIMRANKLASADKISPMMVKAAMKSSKIKSVLSDITEQLSKDATTRLAATGQGFLKEGFQELSEDSINKLYQYGFNASADLVKASGYDWIGDKERYDLKSGNLFEELATSFVVGGLVGSGAGAATFKTPTATDMDNRLENSRAYWLVDVALKGDDSKKKLYTELDRMRKKNLLGVATLSSELDEDGESKKIFGIDTKFKPKVKTAGTLEVDDNELNYQLMKAKADFVFEQVDKLKQNFPDEVTQTKAFANAVGKSIGLYDNTADDLADDTPQSNLLVENNSQIVTIKDAEGNLITIPQEEYNEKVKDKSFEALLKNYTVLDSQQAADEQVDLLSASITQGFNSEVIYVKSQLESANNKLASLLFKGDDTTEFQNIDPNDVISYNYNLKALKKDGDVYFSPKIKKEYSDAISTVKQVKSNEKIQEQIDLQRSTREEIANLKFKIARETNIDAQNALKTELQTRRKLLQDSDTLIKTELTTMLGSDLEAGNMNTIVGALKSANEYEHYLENSLTTRLDYYKRKALLSGASIERFGRFVTDGVEKGTLTFRDLSPYSQDDDEKRKKYFIEHTKTQEIAKDGITKKNIKDINDLATELEESIKSNDVKSINDIVAKTNQYLTTNPEAKLTNEFRTALTKLTETQNKTEVKQTLVNLLSGTSALGSPFYDREFSDDKFGDNLITDEAIDLFIDHVLNTNTTESPDQASLNAETLQVYNNLKDLSTKLINIFNGIDSASIDSIQDDVIKEKVQSIVDLFSKVDATDADTNLRELAVSLNNIISSLSDTQKAALFTELSNISEEFKNTLGVEFPYLMLANLNDLGNYIENGEGEDILKPLDTLEDLPQIFQALHDFEKLLELGNVLRGSVDAVDSIKAIRDIFKDTNRGNVVPVDLTSNEDLEKEFYLNDHKVSKDRKSENLLSQVIDNLRFLLAGDLDKIDINKLEGFVSQSDKPLLSIMLGKVLADAKVASNPDEELPISKALFNPESNLDKLLYTKYTTGLSVEGEAALRDGIDQIKQALADGANFNKEFSAFAQLGLVRELGNSMLLEVGVKTKSRLVQDMEYRSKYLVAYSELFADIVENLDKVTTSTKDKKKLTELKSKLKDVQQAIVDNRLSSDLPTDENTAKALDIELNKTLVKLAEVELAISSIVSSFDNNQTNKLVSQVFEGQKPEQIAKLFKAENYELETPFMPKDEKSLEMLELKVNLMASLRVDNLGSYYNTLSTMYQKDGENVTKGFTTTFEQQLVLKDAYSLIANGNNTDKLKEYWGAVADVIHANLNKKDPNTGQLYGDKQAARNYYQNSKKKIQAYFLAKFIRGYAGTGKTTFLTKGILKLVNYTKENANKTGDKRIKILVTAPAGSQLTTIQAEINALNIELKAKKEDNVIIEVKPLSEISNKSANELNSEYDMILIDEATLLTTEQYHKTLDTFNSSTTDSEKSSNKQTSLKEKIRLFNKPFFLIGDEVQKGNGEFGAILFVEGSSRDTSSYFIPRTAPLVNPMRTGKVDSAEFQKNTISGIVELSVLPPSNVFLTTAMEPSKTIKALKNFKGKVGPSNYMSIAIAMLRETIYNPIKTKYFSTNGIIEEGIRFVKEGNNSALVGEFLKHYKHLKNNKKLVKNQKVLKLIVVDEKQLATLRAELAGKVDNVNDLVISAIEAQGQSIDHVYVYMVNELDTADISAYRKLLDTAKKLFVGISREKQSMTISLPMINDRAATKEVTAVQGIRRYPVSERVEDKTLINKFKPSMDGKKVSEDIVARQKSTGELFSMISKLGASTATGSTQSGQPTSQTPPPPSGQSTGGVQQTGVPPIGTSSTNQQAAQNNPAAKLEAELAKMSAEMKKLEAEFNAKPLDEKITFIEAERAQELNNNKFKIQDEAPATTLVDSINAKYDKWVEDVRNADSWDANNPFNIGDTVSIMIGDDLIPTEWKVTGVVQGTQIRVSKDVTDTDGNTTTITQDIVIEDLKKLIEVSSLSPEQLRAQYIEVLEDKVEGKLGFTPLLSPDNSNGLNSEYLTTWFTAWVNNLDKTLPASVLSQIKHSGNHVSKVLGFLNNLKTFLDKFDISTPEGLASFQALQKEISEGKDPISNFLNSDKVSEYFEFPSLQALLEEGGIFNLPNIKEVLRDKYKTNIEALEEQEIVEVNNTTNEIKNRDEILDSVEGMENILGRMKGTLIDIASTIFKTTLSMKIRNTKSLKENTFKVSKGKLEVNLVAGEFNKAYVNHLLNRIFGELISMTSPKLQKYRKYKNDSNKKKRQSDLNDALNLTEANDPFMSKVFDSITKAIGSGELSELKLNAIITSLLETSNPASNFSTEIKDMLSTFIKDGGTDIFTLYEILKEEENKIELLLLDGTKPTKQDIDNLDQVKTEYLESLFKYVDLVLANPYFLLINKQVIVNTDTNESLFNFIFKEAILSNINNKNKVIPIEVQNKLSEIAQAISDPNIFNLQDMKAMKKDLDKVQEAIDLAQNEVEEVDVTEPIQDELSKQDEILKATISINEIVSLLEAENSLPDTDEGFVPDYIKKCN